MGLSIYFRSIDPMHPALAYEINQRVQQLSAPFSWIMCDAPEFTHTTDGHLTGAAEPIFTDDALDDADDEGTLLTLIDVLAELSRELAVDWEFSHDYEPDVIGRIFEGVIEPELADEIESVLSIGSLFGDLIDEEEDWEEPTSHLGVWRVEAAQFPSNLPSSRDHLSLSSETQDSSRPTQTIAGQNSFKPKLMEQFDEPRVLKFPGVE